MDAILATIVIDGRAVIKIRDVDKNNFISTLIKVLLPCLAPPTGRRRIGSCGSNKSSLLEGRAALPPWSRCVQQFVVCCGWSHDIMRSSYEKRYKTNLMEGLRITNVWFCPTYACTTPSCVAAQGCTHLTFPLHMKVLKHFLYPMWHYGSGK
jgi:hypothetical protein